MFIVWKDWAWFTKETLPFFPSFKTWKRVVSWGQWLISSIGRSIFIRFAVEGWLTSQFSLEFWTLVAAKTGNSFLFLQIWKQEQLKSLKFLVFSEVDDLISAFAYLQIMPRVGSNIQVTPTAKLNPSLPFALFSPFLPHSLPLANISIMSWEVHCVQRSVQPDFWVAGF